MRWSRTSAWGENVVVSNQGLMIHAVHIQVSGQDRIEQRKDSGHPRIAGGRWPTPAGIDLVAEVEPDDVVVILHHSRQLAKEQLLGGAIPGSVKNASPARLNGGRKNQPLSCPVKTVISASSSRCAIKVSSLIQPLKMQGLTQAGLG